MDYFVDVLLNISGGGNYKVSLQFLHGLCILHTNNDNLNLEKVIIILKRNYILLSTNPFVYMKNLDMENGATISLFNGVNYSYTCKEYGVTIILGLKQRFADHLKYVLSYLGISDLLVDIVSLCNFVKYTCEDQIILRKGKVNCSKYNKRCETDWENVMTIGQLNCDFIVCMTNKHLIIADQHAIHERIRLEKMQERSSENLDILKERACRGAIKFGQQLTIEQISRLITDLSMCRYPTICAHGRNSIVYVDREKLKGDKNNK